MIDNHKSIGGYFELELSQGSEYHSSAIALNTGRNCLEYILRVRGYKKLYLPYYSCEVLLEPMMKLGIEHVFYHIDERLEIDGNIHLGDGEALLYINYFGLKQDYVDTLATKFGKRLVVDNTQAFYAQPIQGIDTFYSCRKFFGVADGAYLYCDQQLDMELEQDHSWDRMTHLLKRIDVSPEAAYNDFSRQDDHLKDNPIRSMSQLTRRIMASIDYDIVKTKRRENYLLLESALSETNGISLSLSNGAVPMVYPYLTYNPELRQHLIDNKIYVATYWPNVENMGGQNSVGVVLSKNLIPLPIDQRYGSEEENRIVKFIINL